MTIHKYCDLGYQLDLLGRPIQLNDRVLFKGKYSPTINARGTIIKVNKKTVKIQYDATHYHTVYSYTTSAPLPKLTKVEISTLNRPGFDCLVINELEATSTQLFTDFENNHPELAV